MRNTSSPDRRLVKGASVVALVLAAGICRAAVAQVRPTILDSGDVKESKRQPSAVDRYQVGGIRPSRPSYGVLIILTDPKNAEVSIDGKPAGKAIDGRFKKELPTRRQYVVSVSAGPKYEQHKETVTLKPREPAIVEAALLSKFGTLRIFPAKEGVKLLDDERPVAAENLTIDKENRFVLEGLTPGKHAITYDLPGFIIYGRTFNVTAGSEHIWNFEPQRAVVEMLVVTEPKTTVYVDEKQQGVTPADGILKQVVELGKHDLKLVKEDYEEYMTTLTFEYGKPLRIERALVPLPTSAEFSDDFDIPKPNLWTMRSGAAFKEGRLQLDSATDLCTPTNIRYRDFEMNFHLILSNGAGAAWAVRVKESNEYYLFYLSGPEGLFPSRFNTYIIRNNEFDPAKPVRSDNVITRLIAGGQYDIHIIATRNRIEHQIIPAETGKAVNLGFFEDPNSTFLLGGIGFRTVGRERFSIDELLVKPR